MKATYMTDAYQRRCLVSQDAALRLFADPYGAEQKAAQWTPITSQQREQLLATATKQQDVDYDEAQSKQYGRPIWR